MNVSRMINKRMKSLRISSGLHSKASPVSSTQEELSERKPSRCSKLMRNPSGLSMPPALEKKNMDPFSRRPRPISQGRRSPMLRESSSLVLCNCSFSVGRFCDVMIAGWILPLYYGFVILLLLLLLFFLFLLFRRDEVVRMRVTVRRKCIQRREGGAHSLLPHGNERADYVQGSRKRVVPSNLRVMTRKFLWRRGSVH